MRKIGLLGGTFDPPHIGHFIIAQEVKNNLELDEVWFIPNGEAPHKKGAFFEASDRYKMLEAAVKTTDTYQVKSLELQREGKSYTIDTVKELTKAYPHDHFHFIIGADMVEYLPQWHKIDELLSLVAFVGVSRKDYSLSTVYPITSIEMPLIEISSTFIRKQLRKGHDVQYFLPHEVYLYIKEHY